MLEKLKTLWQSRTRQAVHVRWLLALARPYRGRLAASVIIGVAATAASLLSTIVSKQIVDGAMAGARQNHILMWLGVFLALMLVMQGFTVLGGFLSLKLGESCAFDIRKKQFGRLLAAQWLHTQQYHTGDIMTRLTSDVGTVADGITNLLPGTLSLVIQLGLVFCTLFYYSPLLAMASLLVAPVAALLSIVVGRRLKPLAVKVQESESSYRSFLQESLANLLIVKAFQQEEPSVRQFEKLRKNRFHWVLKQFKINITSSTIIYLAFQLGYIIAFTYGALQISAGAITFGTMTVFLSLVNRVQTPIIELARKLPSFITVLASAGRVMELQQLPEEKRIGTLAATRLGVKIDKLGFAYNEKEPVFEDASLTIQPGQTVAIMGESGIGKTTLIRLVESFIACRQQEICFVNEAGEAVPANAALREHLAYVPQGNTLFSGSIRQNLLVGKPTATEEELQAALRQAAAHQFVAQLPSGLDTRIGERGQGLSEGQAQRIAIARALVRGAPFLILDEATSALDEKTEVDVLAALAQLQPRPTCLLITHRKSVLPFCDRVIRIRESKIEELAVCAGRLPLDAAKA